MTEKKVDIKELIEANKGYNGQIDEDYLQLFLMYRKLFVDYLIEKTELLQYEKKLDESEYHIKALEEDSMDFYQYLSSDKLKYFYVRNNFYVERLSEEEASFFKDKIKRDDYELDDASKDMIKGSFKKVIFEDVGKDGNVYTTFYGPTTSTYMAPNNALVIGLRYEDYYMNGLNDEQWGVNRGEQLWFIQDLSSELIVKEELNMSVPIRVLKYNDFSIHERVTSKNNDMSERDER